jgi:hypothetical protein
MRLDCRRSELPVSCRRAEPAQRALAQSGIEPRDRTRDRRRVEPLFALIQRLCGAFQRKMNLAQRASTSERRGLLRPTGPISSAASRGPASPPEPSRFPVCRRSRRSRRPRCDGCRRRPRRRSRPEGTSRTDEAEGRPCRPLERHGRVEAGYRQRARRRLPRLRGLEACGAHLADELCGRDAPVSRDPSLGSGL